MKKIILVALALVFVFGITGTTFAATNPFADVPAKHWAYDAVAKLAQVGILDGYGDGTYRGERIASRYELAQATAKAMARADKADAQMKGLIDKLAVEFAAELNNLGVRVAKLEKNASTIKFWGDSRLRFMQNNAGTVDSNGATAASFWDQRLRIWTKANVNDKAVFYGRILANWRDISAYGTSYESSIYWDIGFFEWTLNPKLRVAVGRQQIQSSENMFFTTGGYDAIQFMFGAPSDKFKAKVGYGDVATFVPNGNPISNAKTKPVILVDANYMVSKDWKANVSAYISTTADLPTTFSPAGTYVGGYPFQVYDIGFTGKLNENFNLRAQYFWNTAPTVASMTDDQHNGWMAELKFKGANQMKVGTWGLTITYRDIKPWAIDWANVQGMLINSMGNNLANSFGQKGFGFSANYTVSKRTVVTATYESISRNSNADSRRLLPFYYVQMNVSF